MEGSFPAFGLFFFYAFDNLGGLFCFNLTRIDWAFDFWILKIFGGKTMMNNRFYTGYPRAWEWHFAIDDENVVLRNRQNYSKIVYNIPTGKRIKITQAECKLLKDAGWQVKDARTKMWETIKRG